jgi:hypothetical protein
MRKYYDFWVRKEEIDTWAHDFRIQFPDPDPDTIVHTFPIGWPCSVVSSDPEVEIWIKLKYSKIIVKDVTV